MRFVAWLLLAACSHQRPSAGPPSATGSATSCADARVKGQITDQLYRDAEFREFSCDEPTCDAHAFARTLGFEQKVLRERPKLLGCFVVPSGWRLRNMFALFTLNGHELRYQLTYLGNSLDPDAPRADGRPRDLIGYHKLDAATWIKERFIWSTRGYVWYGEEEEKPAAP